MRQVLDRSLLSTNKKYTQVDNDDLLRRAWQLDSDALAYIHDRFYPEVYRFVRFRLDDEAVVEDIASEVFFIFLDSLHKQRGPNQNLQRWLLGTASHLVSDHLRRRYRRKEEVLNERKENEVIDPVSPETITEVNSLRMTILQALQKLTPDQQQILSLRFSQDRSLEETAQIVGRKVNAVKALQFRALASLRRHLAEDKEDEV